MLRSTLTALALVSVILQSGSGGRTFVLSVRSGSLTGPLIDGATVCLDGVGKTTTSGKVTFTNVQLGTHAVKAWKSGFRVQEFLISVTQASEQNIERVTLLGTGSGTAPCTTGAPAPAAPSPDAPQLPFFSINNDASWISPTTQVRLYVRTNGKPATEMRVSETGPTFPESWATWKPFRVNAQGYVEFPMENNPTYPSPTGRLVGTAPIKPVYVQIRNGSLVSGVAYDDIIVYAPVRLTAKVVDSARGQPLSNAIVCVGDTGKVTTTTGEAVFDQAEPGLRTIKAWADGHGIKQVNQTFGPTTPAALTLNFSLSVTTSAVNPPCAVPSSPERRTTLPPGSTPVELPVRLASISINKSVTMDVGDRVFIYPAVLGGVVPTHVRVSETSDQFPESWATWKPYLLASNGSLQFLTGGPPTGYPTPNGRFASAAATKRVWVQVRRGDRESEITSAAIGVTQFYTVSADELAANTTWDGVGERIENGTGRIVEQLVSRSPDCNARVSDGALELGGPKNVIFTQGCLYYLFRNKALVQGWSFQDYTVDNDLIGLCKVTWVLRPRVNGTFVDTKLMISKELEHATCGLRFVLLKLKGPAGLRWQDGMVK